MNKRLDIEAIRQRVEKATEGPWLHAGGKFGEPVITSYRDGMNITEEVIYDYDADFIAHAREDIPALLTEVEQLRIENEKYRQALSQIAHGDTWTAYPHDIAAWALGLERGGGDSE